MPDVIWGLETRNESRIKFPISGADREVGSDTSLNRKREFGLKRRSVLHFLFLGLSEPLRDRYLPPRSSQSTAGRQPEWSCKAVSSRITEKDSKKVAEATGRGKVQVSVCDRSWTHQVRAGGRYLGSIYPKVKGLGVDGGREEREGC